MKKSHKALKALILALSKLKPTKTQKEKLRFLVAEVEKESYFEGYSDGIEVSEKIIDRKITESERECGHGPRYDSRMIVW